MKLFLSLFLHLMILITAPACFSMKIWKHPRKSFFLFNGSEFRWKFEVYKTILQIGFSLSLARAFDCIKMEKIQRLLSVEKFGEEKYFFAMQRVGSFFNGFWPGYEKVSKFRLSLSIFNAMEILIYSIFQLQFIIEHGNDLKIVLDALTPCATQIVCGIKLLVVFHQRHQLRIIFKYLRENFVNGKKWMKFEMKRIHP